MRSMRLVLILSLAIAAIISRCDGSETLERLAWQTRADTVWQAHRTAMTSTLDSLDSAYLRRGYRSLQEMDSLSREGLRRIKR